MLLQLDFSSEIPIYLQIRNQIVIGIAEGQLKPGDKLPTIRALAQEAGINMMTVNKAYALLKQEGHIIADRRSGAAVSGIPLEGGLDEKEKEALRLLVSQAKLSGMKLNELLELCTAYYENEEEER